MKKFERGNRKLAIKKLKWTRKLIIISRDTRSSLHAVRILLIKINWEHKLVPALLKERVGEKVIISGGKATHGVIFFLFFHRLVGWSIRYLRGTLQTHSH